MDDHILIHPKTMVTKWAKGGLDYTASTVRNKTAQKVLNSNIVC